MLSEIGQCDYPGVPDIRNPSNHANTAHDLMTLLWQLPNVLDNIHERPADVILSGIVSARHYSDYPLGHHPSAKQAVVDPNIDVIYVNILCNRILLTAS
jgi:hypothetical protein